MGFSILAYEWDCTAASTIAKLLVILKLQAGVLFGVMARWTGPLVSTTWRAGAGVTPFRRAPGSSR